MITLSALARLASSFPEDLDLPVAPLLIGDQKFDTDQCPVVMGVVNLSQDSSYRESIATSTRTAIRKGRVQAAQGATIVDLGAESSYGPTARVSPADQIATLVPVVEALAADSILVSTESYAPEVVRACLQAGATVINLTGSTEDRVMFELAAEFEATLVLCHIKGAHARDLDQRDLESDPVPALLEEFGARIELARSLGADRLVLDPGVGFSFRAAEDATERARHQAMMLLHTFRMRRLGLPICQAMPHAFHLFEDQFRTAEGFFAVFAQLGGTGLYRTHEVPQILAVLDAMADLSV